MLLFFDSETTGLKPGQICQLSFIAEDNGKVVDAKNYYFKVNEVQSGAQEVHKLSVELLQELSQGKEFKDRANEVLSYFKDSMIIAHNERFDERFITAEFSRLGYNYTPVNRHCTMNWFRDILKIPATGKKVSSSYKEPKLSEVVDYFGIDKDKIIQYSKHLFGGDNITYHDSRFDTAAMYIASNIQRERKCGGNNWEKMFCIK